MIDDQMLLIRRSELMDLLREQRACEKIFANVTIRVARGGSGYWDHEVGMVGEEVLGYVRTHNRITLRGLEMARNQWLNVGPSPNFMGLGTDEAPPSGSEEQLGNEVYRKVISRRLKGPNYAGFMTFFPASEGTNDTIREVGLFAGAGYTTDDVPLGGGVLVARATITPITWVTGDVQFTITWQISNAAGG